MSAHTLRRQVHPDELPLSSQLAPREEKEANLADMRIDHSPSSTPSSSQAFNAPLNEDDFVQGAEGNFSTVHRAIVRLQEQGKWEPIQRVVQRAMVADTDGTHAGLVMDFIKILQNRDFPNKSVLTTKYHSAETVEEKARSEMVLRSVIADFAGECSKTPMDHAKEVIGIVYGLEGVDVGRATEWI